MLPGRHAGLAALAVLVGCLLAAPRVRGDDAAAGRRHAQRASHLAAGGRCRQAIAEFDKAIAVLHDPSLLFNRGECHRKLGNADSALEDYNQFLADLPSAPNRAQVQARIAELGQLRTKGADPAKVPPAVASAPTAVEELRGPSRTSPTTRVGIPATSSGDASSLPLPIADATPGPAPAEASPARETEPPVGVALAPPLGTSPAAPESSSLGDSLARKPWFWIALAAVVAGAGVGAYFALGRDPTNVPRSDLGNYRF